jgi:hypothetical protein
VLVVFRDDSLPQINVTDREGCVALPSERSDYWVVHFDTPAVEQVTLEVP